MVTEIAESEAPAAPRAGKRRPPTADPARTCRPHAAQQRLHQMVVDAVAAPTTKSAYGHALDLFFRFTQGRSLSRALLHEWRSS